MYEAEPFAAEAAENGLAEDAPEPSSKKMTHAESVGTEDRACMQAEGDVSVQSLGEQKEKRADNRAVAKAAEKQSAGDESDHSVNTGAVVSPVEKLYKAVATMFSDLLKFTGSDYFCIFQFFRYFRNIISRNI